MISLPKVLCRLKNNLAKQVGFTLIELLVVIGILGVLAAALVATIDPFEQLKKAADANVKNTAVEFINANIRYYTTHSAMPWGVANNPCNGGAAPTGSLTNYMGCLDLLIIDGELKSAFTTVTDVLSAIKINGTTQDVTACFQPQSRAQRNDPNTHFNSDGSSVTDTSCPNATSTSCYWCSE